MLLPLILCIQPLISLFLYCFSSVSRNTPWYHPMEKSEIILHIAIYKQYSSVSNASFRQVFLMNISFLQIFFDEFFQSVSLKISNFLQQLIPATSFNGLSGSKTELQLLKWPSLWFYLQVIIDVSFFVPFWHLFHHIFSFTIINW